jgi:molecular chaperone DnaK (HSP70)
VLFPLLMRSQPKEQVLIIDAGGGTIDISTYTVLSNNPLQVEELYEPKCESGQLQR